MNGFENLKERVILREQFKSEIGYYWETLHGTPDVDYVLWLESKLIAEQKKAEDVSPSLPADYDSGLLNDYGGGNVDWWQDYIREEIARCNGYWRDYFEGL